MNSKDVKEIFFSLGADLCGIASINRFDDAPSGYHPLDVLPSCKSVISFVCRFPAGTLCCKTAVPYTRVRNSITPKMDAMALNFCIEMGKKAFCQFQFLQMKVNGTKKQEDGVQLFHKSTRHKQLV